jgi:hypothetical protein
MNEDNGRVGFGKFFEDEGGFCDGCAGEFYEGVGFTDLEVGIVKGAFVAASEDRDYAGVGGLIEEGEEIVDCADAGVVD